MLYTIYHLTRFRYDAPVYENMMELRMQPLTEDAQRCLRFDLRTRPQARIFSYVDFRGNHIHYFDRPAPHRELTTVAVSTVTVPASDPLPDSLPQEAWQSIAQAAREPQLWELTQPTELTGNSELLRGLARELNLARHDDPLTTLIRLNHRLFKSLQYDVEATDVDSPIDIALTNRRGVCQDYAHIMLALLRNYLDLPCRYVSGYLYHSDDDRSADGASHAWVEVWLDSLGWIGFDPTNDILAGERHIRVAVGVDYREVPPTRGIYKGEAVGDLQVRVRVRKTDEADAEDELPEALAEPLAVGLEQESIYSAAQAQQQ